MHLDSEAALPSGGCPARCWTASTCRWRCTRSRPAYLLDGLDGAEPTDAVAVRVARARAVAAERLRGTGWRINADVPGPQLRTRWRLPAAITAAVPTTASTAAS